ncbi:hypothetical protein H4F99_11495 [Lysobacter sp. SG-8]|uniref:Uncharacterized protein n=1 Tax=Marilutibacter penaei TaxID=2759900 RepID=A0A7W3U515_9GAMM|nr:hypothetical protein [Lysobacter penaei]MBB1089104.1 hypothetical protein [Lysobacter penaei]
MSASFEDRLAELATKSRRTLLTTLVFVISIVIGIWYLTSNSIKLKNTIIQQERVIAENKSIIEQDRATLAQLSSEIDKNKQTMTHIESGIRSLLVRNYPNAIQEFKAFLELRPEDSSALNYLGYSEYRYWLVVRKGTKAEDVLLASQLAQAAEEHLRDAVELSDGDNIWPLYNLTLFLYQSERGDEAATRLKILLDNHDLALGYLCSDGQFRRFRLASTTGPEFARIVSEAAANANMANCWVVSGKE